MSLYRSRISLFVISIMVYALHALFINMSFLSKQAYMKRGGSLSTHKIYLVGSNKKSDVKEKRGDAEKKKTIKRQMAPPEEFQPVAKVGDKVDKARPDKVQGNEILNLTDLEDETFLLDDNEREGQVDEAMGGGPEEELAGSLSTGQIKNDYINYIAGEIEKNKWYPAEAKKNYETGAVKVFFVIKKDGLVSDLRLKKGCSYSALNAAALELIAKIKKFKPIPDKLNLENMNLSINIFYTLDYLIKG